MLFVNSPALFDATYQRYLLNVFREQLPFHDIPLKLYLRARTQTDPNAPKKSKEDSESGESRAFEDDFGTDNLEINELLDDLGD